MRDRELYEKLLGLEKPWKVTDIQVDYDNLKIDLNVEWPQGLLAPCPECKNPSKIHDHRNERCWRHLDTMQFQTIVHCKIPRVECKKHGVITIETPWSEPHSRFTALFERLAIDVLLSCSNQTKAMKLIGLSWDEVHHIQEKAVRRGLERREVKTMEYLGVDEKSFLKGHKYATIVSDIQRRCVYDVSQDRKEESLDEILKIMAEDQRASVKAVAMDMWEPYANSVRNNLPDADIVHDKFHISMHLNKVVDKIRRRENKELIKAGSDLLKGSKYLWLKNQNNLNQDQKSAFQDLKQEGLKVGRAWAIKEAFSEIWKYVYEESARKFFKWWYWWATHSRLKPVVEAAKMLKRHLERILTYLKHHITNAVAEAINSTIQHIKASARGFRNFQNYRTAILFYCGKLNMYPHKSL